MLARANRLVTAEDYRNTVRRGRRTRTGNTVVYVIQHPGGTAPRFGFIVSRAVGNAVTRNLIRRRLKSVCRSVIDTVGPDTDVVVRALPGALELTWSELREEVTSAVGRGFRR